MGSSLINFIGSPGSGKTTIAAFVFSFLKENGIAAEFISEQARLYIAMKKFINRFNFNEIQLTDFDQIKILEQQLSVENSITYSTNSIVISDSSPLNSLLYMHGDTLKNSKILNYINNIRRLNPTIFYSPPIENLQIQPDPNRIHDISTSLEIDKKIQPLLEKLNFNSIKLNGTSRERAQVVIDFIRSGQ